jgi:membrane-associated phospholipid phosphatase
MHLLASFWQTLKTWDQTGLFHINQVWQNRYFDAILPWLRESALWLPLYFFFLSFVIINYGKKGVFWLLFFIATVSLSDQLSSNFLKNFIGRVRPCNDPFMLQFIDLRIERCPSSFSFTSSHATNHFAIAMFVHQTLKKVLDNKTRWMFLWAFVICYSQMYIGVHYPIDILGGMLVGIFFAGITAALFNWKLAFESVPGNLRTTAA